MNIHNQTIDDDTLLRQFVSANMYVYFRLKAPELEPQELKVRLTELVKFLLMSHKFPGNILFGRDLDDLWHLWIMQSRQYEMFCRATEPGTFIHHDSNDFPRGHLDWQDAEKLAQGMKAEKDAVGLVRPPPPIGTPEFEEGVHRLLSFFTSYVISYGPLKAENVKYWPPVARMLRRLNWSVDEFNAFMLAQAQSVTTIPEMAHV
ncbi:MAG: hypothetical protein ACRDBL_12570 [Rhabdaerophilum sp.]